MKEKIGDCDGKLDQIIDKIESKFFVKKLSHRLNDELNAKGFIKNHYGRMIRIVDPKTTALVNYYVQSTGVDVAMLGFHEIIKSFIGREDFVPIFLLHDAMYVDCTNEAFQDLSRITRIHVDGYAQKFVLKTERV